MKNTLNEIASIDPEKINLEDKLFIKNLIVKLLGIIESQQQINEDQKQEIQNLKDEVNHLKGEKGKPKIPPNVPKKENDVVQKKKPSQIY